MGAVFIVSYGILFSGGPEISAGVHSFFEPIIPVRSIDAMADGSGLLQVPPYSAAALEHAVADTIPWIAFDVSLTQDGQHVLLTDEQLMPVTGLSGRVQDFSMEELLAIDIGVRFADRFTNERLLPLTSALKLAQGRINLHLRCCSVNPQKLLQEISDSAMQRQVVLSGTTEALTAIRQCLPVDNPANQPANRSETPAFMKEWTPGTPVDAWYADLQPAVAMVSASSVTPEVCAEFHSRNVQVLANCQNDSDDNATAWDRMKQCGADWILTLRPEELVSRTILSSLKSKPIRIAHHRGAARYAPENTLACLQKSIALGADFVEFDVRTTSDQVLVLMHDGSLDRTTNGQGPVSSQTAAALKTLDAGSWFGPAFRGTPIPLLDDFLKAMDAKTRLYFDAKEITPERLVAVLQHHGMTDRACVYQSADYLERLMKLAPDIRRMPAVRSAEELDGIVTRLKPFAVDMRWSILSKSLIEQCHARGIRVYSDALGPNESIDKYQQAIRDGIDVIQTDYPLQVLRALELMDAATAVQ